MLLRRALVIGAGPLAQAMAADLRATRDLFVQVVDDGEAAGGDAFRALASEFDVVLSALAPASAAAALRELIVAKRLVADAGARVADALLLDPLARETPVAVCVGCAELARLLASPAASAESGDVRAAALVTTALARRLLTGDFRPHWGIWTPSLLAARVGIVHGVLQDLRERGVDLRRDLR